MHNKYNKDEIMIYFNIGGLRMKNNIQINKQIKVGQRQVFDKNLFCKFRTMIIKLGDIEPCFLAFNKAKNKDEI